MGMPATAVLRVRQIDTADRLLQCVADSIPGPLEPFRQAGRTSLAPALDHGPTNLYSMERGRAR